MLRASEISLENRYNYFVIVKSDTVFYTSTHMSGNVNSTGSFNASSYDVNKPSVSMTIECFVEKPELEGTIYSAEFLSKSIKGKYDI